jgi:hypothetical protein
MQDRAVAEAIVAGNADGIAEAYDRYAACLYAYCHSVLPEPEAAAQAVRDTFIIAVARLDGLGEPDRLGAWLQAVARNECLRLPGYRAGAGLAGGPADPDHARPAVTLPAGLRRQVLTACADNSPTGRACRMSVAHRAGPFGPSGFPRAAGASGPRWWRRVRRHRGVMAAAAVLATTAVTAAISVTMTAGGSYRPQATPLRLGAAVPAPAASAAPGSASASSSPTHRASPPALPVRTPTPPVTMPGGAPRPGTPPGRGTPEPSARPSASPTPSPTPSPSRTPSPSPTPSPTPSPGYLVVAPNSLQLVSTTGKAASGFLLTAKNGPVSDYTITVPAAMAGKVTVSPSRGSLPAGGFVEVTVTVTSKVALTTHITVEPGNLTVTVVFKI